MAAVPVTTKYELGGQGNFNIRAWKLLGDGAGTTIDTGFIKCVGAWLQAAAAANDVGLTIIDGTVTCAAAPTNAQVYYLMAVGY